MATISKETASKLASLLIHHDAAVTVSLANVEGSIEIVRVDNRNQTATTGTTFDLDMKWPQGTAVVTGISSDGLRRDLSALLREASEHMKSLAEPMKVQPHDWYRRHAPKPNVKKLRK